MKYTVQQGDCLTSIADAHGFFFETLWNHPDNASLKAARKDHNTLLPGDILSIPDLRVKTVTAAHEKLHVFRLKGVPAKITLRLLDEGEPRKNQPYLLEIDGRLFTGQTDGDGKLTERIPPGAQRGKLTVGVDPNKAVYRLKLGHLDPVTEVSGLQGRLNNLGFFCGRVTGEMNEDTVKALKGFQASQSLPATGKFDAATIDKLRSQEQG